MSVFVVSVPVIVIRSCLVIADSKEDAMQAIGKEGAKATAQVLHTDDTYEFVLQDGKVSVSVHQLDAPNGVTNETPPSGTVLQ